MVNSKSLPTASILALPNSITTSLPAITELDIVLFTTAVGVLRLAGAVGLPLIEDDGRLFVNVNAQHVPVVSSQS